jgi:pectate lyase
MKYRGRILLWLSIIPLVSASANAAVPNFDRVGFATLDGFNTFGYNQQKIGGVTGGAGGLHVQVSTVTNLVNNLQSNATLMVEVMTNLDLSILANNSGGFPAGYPSGSP